MGEDVRLGSIGGYLAGNGTSAVVVLHEWGGVVPHIRDVTDRVAAAGFTAVALDLYDGESAANETEAARLQRRILADPDTAAARIAGAVEELRGWRQWFASSGVEPYEVVYEDLSQDRLGEVNRVLEFLDLPQRYAEDLPPARYRKQADDLTDYYVDLVRSALAG